MKKNTRNWIIGIVIAVLVIVGIYFMVNNSKHDEYTLTFSNTDQTEANMISMTDEREFEVVLQLEDNKAISKEMLDKITTEGKWVLSREEGKQPIEDFPYQFLGGELQDWTLFDSEEPFFETMVKAEDGKVILTLKNKYFYGEGVDGIDSRSRFPQRNSILDYYGDYTLQLMTDNKVLAETMVTYTPYDSFHDAQDFVADLNQANETINARDDMYSEIRSMGETELGRDMPYIVIADSKDSIDQYMEIKQQAETNPAELMEKIKANELDYRIPVFYTNVHSDENPGGDAPMEFVNDLANSDGKITYKVLTGFTEDGEAQLAKEKEEAGIHWSELVADEFSGLGFITEGNAASTTVDLEKYYTVEEVELDVNELLANVILVVVPMENVDSRTVNMRPNSNGFDLNRDNTFQTQKETQNMAKLIAEWNPTVFAEFHGFISGFQVEPCSPTHGANFEYDLFINNAIEAGQAFGEAAVCNQEQFNSYVMPMRDYLTSDENGNPYWEYPWDDMSTGYTPQYSMLHGAVAFTIEVPEGNEDAVTAFKTGMFNNAKYVASHKDQYFLDQLEGYRRGLENIDADTIRPYYVDINDNPGAEADVFRPRSTENNNYFPEYYVIPMDQTMQENVSDAYKFIEYALRNDIKVSTLTTDVEVNGVNYPAGSYVINMYQAKRNVAQMALDQGTVLTGWTDLYSESIVAFGDLRGFDYTAIRVKDAFADALADVETVEMVKPEITSDNVIIANSSTDAIKAINEIMQAEIKVGYITEGENQGDFVTTLAGYETIKDEYALNVYNTDKEVVATQLKTLKVYVPTAAAEFAVTENTQKEYGFRNYFNLNYTHTERNWDLFALEKQLGFTLVDDVNEADIIVGSSALDEAALAAVKAGTPYVAYSTGALDSVVSLVDGVEYSYGHPYAIEDVLTTVNYLDDSMVTAKYVAEDDHIMYGYGGAYFTALPENAKTLIKTTNDEFLEGFLLKESVEGYKNSIQAFEYRDDTMDIVAFANTLTDKAHQTDDYRYISNAIYQQALTEQY